jgi:hypothetical protein
VLLSAPIKIGSEMLVFYNIVDRRVTSCYEFVVPRWAVASLFSQQR